MSSLRLAILSILKEDPFYRDAIMMRQADDIKNEAAVIRVPQQGKHEKHRTKLRWPHYHMKQGSDVLRLRW